MRFGGRTGWGSYSAPTDPLAVIRKMEGGKEKQRVGNKEGEEGDGKEERE